MIGEKISHYKILEKIGEGGMAHVYKAEDTKLKRTIALKFISPQKLESEDTKIRFIQEAQTAAGLNHPNINTIYEINEIDNKTFIAMEYIEGSTLRDLISLSSLSIGKSLDISCQVAEGLQEAHENGIVHRDIKSSNIMVTSKGQAKIMDFGLVKLEGATQITKASLVMGTVSYMSPEQAGGEEIDFRSDIWSFGVVLYEMLTGRLPFQGTNDQVILYAIQNKRHEPVSSFRSHLPYLFDNIVDRCLKKNPKERYQSVADLRLDLERLKREISSVHATLSMPARQLPGFIRKHFIRRRIILSIALLALLAVIFVTPVPHILKRWFLSPPASQQKSLAVIPNSLIGNAEEIEFCEGLLDFLSSKLTKLHKHQSSFFVIPYSDLQKDEIRSASEAHQKFNAHLVLGLSMRPLEDRFNFILTLSDTEMETPRNLDSETLISNMGNRLVLQDQLLNLCISMLGVELSSKEHEEIFQVGTTNPDSYNFYIQGISYMKRYDKIEHIEIAINLFNRAISLDPNYAEAHAGLAEAYWKKWDKTKEENLVTLAQEYSQRAIGIRKDLPPVHITQGIIYRGTGKYQEALEEFKKALVLEPENAQIYRELGRTYQQSGNLERAEQNYILAIDLLPYYWGGYNQLGHFYYSIGQLEKAVEMFQKVIELTPDNSLGYSNLGGMYLMLGQNDLAEPVLEKAISIQPSGGGYNNLAAVYFNQRKFAEAVRTYETALKYDESRYVIWGNLADSRRYSKEYTEAQYRSEYIQAMTLVQEVLKINPNDNNARAHLAYYQAALGESENAGALISKVLQNTPDEIEIWRRAVLVYEIIGERNSALRSLQVYLEKGGDLNYILIESDLVDLQKDPGFQTIVNKISLKNR